MDAKTILVVEDDDVTRTGFGTILSDHGYKVRLAADGREALDYLQSYGPPDLIILDMLMRGMDGWHFLKRRDARWHSVPVLLTTAIPIANKEWAVSLGACGCLQKPIELETLLEEVRKLL